MEPRYSPALPETPPPAPRPRYALHLLLFLLTAASTTYSGGTLAGRALRFEHLGAWWFVPDGLVFTAGLLCFLTVHEFGHYFAARRHRIDTSLPYYLPMPLILFGTMGAVIRIREAIPDTRKLFDVGASGPLAGFVVALALLVGALLTLPEPSYLLDMEGHAALKAFILEHGRYPAHMLAEPASEGSVSLVFGQTLLFWGLSSLFPNTPPMYEIYHYPVLVAAWLGLFFTALNLLPAGQLDGGHILYTLVGPRWHGRIARAFLYVLLLSGAIGFASDVLPDVQASGPYWGAGAWAGLAALLFFYLHRIFDADHRIIAPGLLGLLGAALAAYHAPGLLSGFGYSGWLMFTLLIVLVVKVDHPPVLREMPLTPRRRRLGILALIIFVLCFSIRPVYIL